jgi:hypothetical protein
MTSHASRAADRLETLSIVARASASVASARIERKHGIGNTIVFERPALAVALDRYWDLVGQFKADQDFRPRARINSPKKAALTIYAVATAEPRIFRPNADDLHPSHVLFAETFFAADVLRTYVETPDNGISERHFSDLSTCLTEIRVAKPECQTVIKFLMCLYADTWWTNCGKADKPGDFDEPPPSTA